MNTIIIPTAQNIELEYPQAGLGIRILATLIDIVVIGLYLFILERLGVNDGTEEIIFTLSIPAMCYTLACEAYFNGQTLGKFLLKTRVINMDGSSPTLSQYILRWMLRLVDLWLPPFLVGLVAITLNKNGQRIGDIIAGTTVIQTKLITHFGDTIFMDTGEDYNIVFPNIRNLSDRDVSILKEVLDAGLKSSNADLLARLTAKVKQVAEIESDLTPRRFLETVLRDYNHLFGRE